jgi:SPP1 family predicted phage head-tail adaptor
MRVSVGDMRDQVAIKRLSTALDPDFNSQSTALLDVATVWAKVVAEVGYESVEASAVRGVSRLSFVVRWLAGVNVGMFVIHETNQYKIVAVEEVARREFIKLHCEIRNDDTA